MHSYTVNLKSTNIRYRGRFCACAASKDYYYYYPNKTTIIRRADAFGTHRVIFEHILLFPISGFCIDGHEKCTILIIIITGYYCVLIAFADRAYYHLQYATLGI